MRVATWNVNGMRARLDLLLGWLESRRPDVVGLQELKMADEQFPHDAIAAAGYRAVAHGQKAWNGVAILSREEVSVTCRGLPGQEEFGSRLLTAEVGGLSFTVVYCPNGKNVEHADFPRKLAWFDALADHFEARHDPGGRSILCGDFNICPTSLDTWNEPLLQGTIFHTEQERARIERLTAWGLTDLYRRLHPDGHEFTWWDYRAGAFPRGQGLRLDLLLGTRPVADSTRSVTIDRDYRKKQEGLTPSDHAPVIADLE